VIRTGITALALCGVTVGCGAQTDSAAPAETVTVTSPAAPAQPSRSNPPVSAAGTLVISATTTRAASQTFAVNNPASDLPGLQPGVWVGTYVGPADQTPHVAACNAWQWAGANKQDVVGLWSTPIGETVLQFPIENVQGFIELSGDCDWSGGGPSE
jgi:hypothetical protein